MSDDKISVEGLFMVAADARKAQLVRVMHNPELSATAKAWAQIMRHYHLTTWQVEDVMKRASYYGELNKAGEEIGHDSPDPL